MNKQCCNLVLLWHNFRALAMCLSVSLDQQSRCQWCSIFRSIWCGHLFPFARGSKSGFFSSPPLFLSQFFLYWILIWNRTLISLHSSALLNHLPSLTRYWYQSLLQPFLALMCFATFKDWSRASSLSIIQEVGMLQNPFVFDVIFNVSLLLFSFWVGDSSFCSWMPNYSLLCL